MVSSKQSKANISIYYNKLSIFSPAEGTQKISTPEIPDRCTSLNSETVNI